MIQRAFSFSASENLGYLWEKYSFVTKKTMLQRALFIASTLLIQFTFAQTDSEYDDNLPLNKIQVLGSHNSYRRQTDKRIWNLVNIFGKVAKGKLKPAQQWEYSHVSLDSQLQIYGLRKFELDVYYDPQGGRYYNRQGNVLTGRSPKSNVDALLWGGMKIIHVPDLDYNTNYYTFKDALRTIKTWSNEHPTHVPIYIMVELKEDAVKNHVNIAGFAKALTFDERAILDLRDEIYSVFDTAKILKPDDVRGNYSTLREAVINRGFPRLKEVRGKVVFILLAPTESRKILSEKYPLFNGLPFFAYSNTNNPDAAFLKCDDPKKDYDKIKQAVDSGFIVRTRADADTQEARDNDYSSFEAAKKSGAQMISTDFYIPFQKTGYVITRNMLRK